MGTPQIILIVLIAMAGTITLLKHGKPREDYSFFSWAVSCAITVGLLYWGGFFG